MKFWGKIIGAFFGFLLAGPLGLVIGVIIGHFFDKGLNLHWQQWSSNFGASSQAQQAFFNTTFLVMGHIAKADGRVSEAEIRVARDTMMRMGLNAEQRKRAIDLFEQGKQPEFDLTEALSQLVQACHANKVLLRIFVELQSQTALAEGSLSPAKQRILQQITRQLGFAPLNFVFFEDFFGYQGHQAGANYQRQNYQSARPSSGIGVQEAYQILEVSTAATDAEVKKAYRKMMSQHHPDKLMSKGLPEEMVKLATAKTQKIKAAYETICTARGI